MPNPIVRDCNPVIPAKDVQSTELQYEWLGTITDIDQTLNEPKFDLAEEPIPTKFTAMPNPIVGTYGQLVDIA